MASTENHILVVDDEPIVRQALVNFFEDKNWVVHTANDGMQAIRCLRDYNPDIILMDIRMPNRDGIAACNIIRRDITLNPDVPVIMMTGYNDKNQIMRSIDAGCNDFILKPFQYETLFDKVEKLVESYHNGSLGNN